MSTIFKFIGNLIAVAYGIFCMPFVLALLIVAPIMTISDGVKIIKTGYTVDDYFVNMLIVILVFVYFSLRFKYLRKIYNFFPSLFETIKFLAITYLFIAIGAEVLNWSYITLSPGRNKFGIAVFIICLILWRVVISFYYYKKPLVNFIPSPEEIMQNYNKEGIS